MNDGAALLRAILLNPADDLPRLVYADWLEERAGEVVCRECAFLKPGASLRQDCPACSGFGRVSNGFAKRAEFIRVQCELAGLTCEIHETRLCTCRWHALRRRERELLSRDWANADAWFCGDCFKLSNVSFADGGLTLKVYPAASPENAGHDIRLVVSRGFVTHASLPLAAFLGGPCENCGGDGEFTRQNSDGPPGPCPDCGGTWSSGPHFDGDSYWDEGTGRTPGVDRIIASKGDGVLIGRAIDEAAKRPQTGLRPSHPMIKVELKPDR